MKKIATVFLAAFILFSLVIPFETVFATRYIGDLSGDKSVTAVDYLTLKRYCLGTYDLSRSSLEAADVNGDGDIGASDYLMVKRSVLGTYDISNPEFFTPVSNGKQYSFSVSPSSTYPDTYSCELTDGIHAKSASYSSNEFCGINSSFFVVLDLGNDGKKLNRFELYYLATTNAGIAAPAAIDLYGSDDGVSWESIGTMTMPAYVENTIQCAYFVPQTELEYQYIKYDLTKKAYWIFIDEIVAYSNIPDYKTYPSDRVFESYRSDTVTDSQRQVNLIALSNGVSYDKEKGKTVISNNCSYEITANGFDWRTGEKSGVLTDGVDTGSYFESQNFVGIDANGGIGITIDLGQKYTTICGFSLHCFKRPAAKIDLPVFVDIFAGDSTDTMINVARSYMTCGEDENFEYFVTLDSIICARYITFYIPANDFYCWVEEAQIFENSGSAPLQYFVYDTPNIPVIEKDIYHNVSDSDYNTHQNLILGKTQQITSDIDLDYEYYGESNTPQTSNLLTDGKYTSDTNCYNGYWFHFSRGTGRNVFYDLGALSAVDSYSIRFLVNDSWGIRLPTKVSLILSQNGKDWYVADTHYPDVLYDEQIFVVERELNKQYKARYALVYMTVAAHVFLDEITVNGTKNIDYATSLSSSGLSTHSVFTGNENQGYMAPDPDILGGAKDVNLVYHTGTVTDEEFLLPYVAYLDQNGNIVDTMFDGFLFLPTTGTLPSGGRPYGTNIKSDWDYLYNDIFASDRCFQALENVADSVKTALGISQLKLKVFVAIPHLDTTLTSFGDVDGDGVSENLTKMDDRIKVTQWYTQKVRTEFDARGYDNLQLNGFYWFHETIEGDDAETAKNVSAMLKYNNEQLFWIPYFQATGFTDWKDFGFVTGCLQPNYAFNLDVPVSRLYYASEIAKKYGMCIELELDNRAFSDDRYFQKYMDYLRCGVEYGYMSDCIHMYYQGVGYFNTACYSTGKYRLIYDYTYQFVKGTLGFDIDSVVDQEYNAYSNKMFSGNLNANDTVGVSFELTKSPSHGTVSVDSNGDFVYYPNKGFSGTDSFCFAANDYLCTSGDCTVTINVE